MEEGVPREDDGAFSMMISHFISHISNHDDKKCTFITQPVPPYVFFTIHFTIIIITVDSVYSVQVQYRRLAGPNNQQKQKRISVTHIRS